PAITLLRVYMLSLHDALPICEGDVRQGRGAGAVSHGHILKLHGAPEPMGGSASAFLVRNNGQNAGDPFSAGNGFGEGNDEIHHLDRKSTRLNSSHVSISYVVF